MPKENKTEILVNLEPCPRCGENHSVMLWELAGDKEVYTHYAFCFQTHQPIIVRYGMEYSKWERLLRDIRYRGADDPEVDHIDADNVMMELVDSMGFEKVVQEFRKITKYYS